MLVRNSAGISVSILNDSSPYSRPPSQQLLTTSTITSELQQQSQPQPQPPSLKRRNAYAFSRKSSYASSHCSESSHTSVSESLDTPVFSPGLRPTPLLRYDSAQSTSSQQSVNTPSPTSPTYQLDPMDQTKPFVINPNDPYYRAAAPYYASAQQPLPPAQSPGMYIPLDSPQTFNLADPYAIPLQHPTPIQFAPYATDLIQPTPPLNLNAQSTTAPAPAATASPDSGSNSGPKTAKKKYPCPHAQKYNCADTFTTSGHAARHGKKHTGEKNIQCPVCKKAFTRKDNMKQHERTHRNKGEASKVAEAVENSKRAHTLSKESTHSSSTDMDVDGAETASQSSDTQATIRAHPPPRRPALAVTQAALQPSIPPQADVPLPVTLDSTETLQQVAPSLHAVPLDKNFSAMVDSGLMSRSQEMILSRRLFVERTTSTGSGFSVDGEGESPGLDALAMAAELS